MAIQKLYAGAKLREQRLKIGHTQKDFAARLGVSLPYLNQMENNNRPVSTTVVLALASEFGMDVTELSSGDSERLASDMNEILSDPLFRGETPPVADVRLTASNAPGMARAFIALHQNYRQAQERLASLDEALGREDARATPSPWEEVRDFFHYCDNYIDAVDRAAEHFAARANDPREMRTIAIEALAATGITVAFTDMDALRLLEPDQSTLHISSRAKPETQTFQLLLQVALKKYDTLLEATLDLARFHSPADHDIAKMGLANYFAGAALLPYTKFQTRAQGCRHDLEVLAQDFGASIEQIAHRLSTCNVPVPRVCRSSLCALIRPEQSRNAIPQPCFNLHGSAARVLCGMCTAPLKHPVSSCVSLLKHLTGCAISRLPVTSQNLQADLAPPHAVLQSLWGAKCAMHLTWFMPTA